MILYSTYYSLNKSLVWSFLFIHCSKINLSPVYIYEQDMYTFWVWYVQSTVAVCSQGCYNGGTCVSPGRCSCATGWTGYNCKTGIV